MTPEPLIALAQATTGGDSQFVWVFGLFGLAFALFVLEIFIPSGGLIGAASFLCALAAVTIAFRISPLSGFGALGVLAFATPTLTWAALKIMPNTPIGRRIILSDGTSEDDLQQRESERAAEAAQISALVGARGETMTSLRPGGTVRIDGEDVEAYAEIGYIEAGVEVEVVAVSGRYLRVRPSENT
ncbi:MAG: NfeD family protein [Phycisphaerales bacterium]